MAMHNVCSYRHPVMLILILQLFLQPFAKLVFINADQRNIQGPMLIWKVFWFWWTSWQAATEQCKPNS